MPGQCRRASSSVLRKRFKVGILTVPDLSHDALRAFAREIMVSLGSNDDEATCVANHLVDSNLKGHDSHGIGMLPTYVDLVAAGLARPNQPLRVVNDFGATLTFEGNRGFGQRIGRDAIDAGIERARTTGAAVVALRNSSHLGRIGTYGEQTVRAGYASVHFVNVADHAALQAVHGAREARLGTNPFCAAVPCQEDVEDDRWVVLDMATSNIALGKARVARNKGVFLDDGCMIDGDGKPTNDPRPMVDDKIGALLPFGGHKGSGLAIVCELLAGGLTGGTSIQPENRRHGGIVNNMLSIIISPSALGQTSLILNEINAVQDWVKAAAVAPGYDSVLVPGEPEKIAKGYRLEHGIPIDDETYRELRLAGEKAGMPAASVNAHLN
jgi:uncharacterized oxidoreductase